MAKKEMYRLDVVIGVTGDGQTKTKLKNTEKFVERTEKRLKKLDKIKVSPSARLNDRVSSTIDKISRKSKLLNKVFTSTARINDRATPILDRLKGKVGIFNKPVDMLISARDSTNSAISSVKAKIQNLKAATIISLNMKADPAIRAISLTRTKLGELGNKLSSMAGRTYQAIVKLKDNVSPTLQSLDGKINTFTKNVVTKFATIATAGAVAFGGIGVGSSIKGFADFEQGMKNVQAVSGATASDMETLTAKAREMGRTTAFTSKDAASALEYMGMAGWKTNDMVSGLPGILNLAAAGSVDLGIASDIVTDGLTAMGLTAKDTDKYVDIMAATITNSNTSVELMGETMKYVGSVGGALGVDMKDLSLAIGLMGNASIKGSQAGTALRGGLTRLIKPPKEAANAMKKYGIEIKKTQDGNLDLAGTMKELRTKLSGLDATTQGSALAMIFGQEAMSGWAAVVNASEGDFNKLSSAIVDSSGKAKEVADIKLESLSGQFELLKSAVDDVKLSLGERLAPYTKDFAKWLTTKMPEIGDAVVDAVDKITTNVPKILKVFKSLMPVISGVIASLLTFKTIMMGISIITTVVPILSNIAFAFASVAGGAATVGEAMTLIMGPVGWITLGIGLLVAIGVALYQNWDTIKSKTTELKNKFIELKTEAIDKIKEGISTLKDKIIDLKDNAIDSATKKIDEFKKILKDNEDQIKTVATVLGVIFGPALIKTGTQAVIAGTKIAIKFTASLIKAGIQAIISAAKLTGSFILSLIKVSAQAIITGVTITGNLILSLIKLGAQAIITSGIMIGNFLISLVRIGAQAITTGATITANLIVALISYAAQGWATVACIAAQTLAWVIQKGTMIAGAAATGIMTAAQWALNAAMSANPIGLVILLVAGLIAGLIVLYNTSETARTVINSAWVSIQTTASSLISSVILAFQGLIMILQGVVNFVVGVFTGNWSMAMSGIEGIVSGAVSLISGLWNGLITLLSAPIQAIVDILDSTFKEKAKGIKDTWEGIKTFLKNPIKGVVSIVESITGKSKSDKKSTTKHATGGIFTTPHYALFAEEPGGEAVIPLNGKRRDRAISLWKETGEKLGMNTEDRYRNAGNQSSYFTKANNGSANQRENRNYDVSDDGNNPYYGFKPYSPQVTVAGGSDININVEVNNSFDSDMDEEYIIDETCNKVGAKLREAFKNTKR